MLRLIVLTGSGMTRVTAVLIIRSCNMLIVSTRVYWSRIGSQTAMAAVAGEISVTAVAAPLDSPLIGGRSACAVSSLNITVAIHVGAGKVRSGSSKGVSGIQSKSVVSSLSRYCREICVSLGHVEIDAAVNHMRIWEVFVTSCTGSVELADMCPMSTG